MIFLKSPLARVLTDPFFYINPGIIGIFNIIFICV